MIEKFLSRGCCLTQGVLGMLYITVLLIVGCGRGDDVNKAAAPKSASGKFADGAEGKTKTTVNGVAPASVTQPEQTDLRESVGDAPSIAVQQILLALAGGQPMELWNALPEIYQQDLNGLTRASVALIDPVVRAKFFSVLIKAGTVLGNKKATIFTVLQAMPEAHKSGSEVAWILANYDRIVALSGVLAQSDLANPAWQQNPDLGTLLSKNGREIMMHGLSLANFSGFENVTKKLSELKGVKVVMGRAQGASPTVVIITTRAVTTNEVLKVKGKWLPQNLVLAWNPLISQIQEKISGRPITARSKQLVLRGMDMANEALLSIEQAQDTPQMVQAIGNLMRVYDMLAGGKESAAEQLPAARRNLWNYGAGDRNTRIDAFIGQPQAAVEKVFGPPDSRVPSQNLQQVEIFWLYHKMVINDLTKNSRATKVYFAFKNGVVVNVLVAP